MREYCPKNTHRNTNTIHRGNTNNTNTISIIPSYSGCSCMPSILVETAQDKGLHPFGTCTTGCVCIQHTCDKEFHWSYEGVTGPKYWGEQFQVIKLQYLSI